MKKLLAIVSTILVMTVSFVADGQEQPVYPGESIPFEITIIGTRYHTDVSPIIKGLRRSPSAKNLVPHSETQNNVVYTGSYLGTPEALASDIGGLAADRFGLESRQEKDGRWIFTLKKSSPIVPSAPDFNAPQQDISGE